MNFDFLKRDDGYYDLFADACIEAEKVFSTSPAMCAVGCRKALELAVKWVYAIDNTIEMPYKDNLSSLIHEYTFKSCVDERVWRQLIAINKLGNLAVHTERAVRPQDAILSLRALFDFVDWIDYCYGPDYKERTFDEKKIPPAGVPLSKEAIRTIKQHEELVSIQKETIEKLEAQLKTMSSQIVGMREKNISERSFNPEEITEYKTRKLYIDTDLRLAGWQLDKDVIEEYEVHGMPVEPENATGRGLIDYLLVGKDAKPLAILEAKRTMYSPQKGLQQARLYSDCINAKFGYRPPIFLSNGFETFFVDDEEAPMRKVSGIFSRDELQTILNRRGTVLPLSAVKVDMDISGRYYQVEAIRRVCANIEEGHRKSLLVMATGTGKTRVSAGLTDVLMRSNRVKNVLFLADRVALVSQAKHAYQSYLPNASLCNLCKNKDERDARIVFSTYPTILNAIDSIKNNDGDRMYTPAHFDLIIIDEAHRSIFKKYKAIFDYFDALLVGLTATPANEVDRNTYDFFEVERGVPTYVYEYETAVNQDHVLAPFLGIETHTSFLDEGITYDDLSDEDKERIDEDFEAAGEETPEYIPETDIDRWLFNQQTVDNVLETLMNEGIHVDGGENLGKSIIFAANQPHARYIEERFGKLYPKQAKGGYIKTVIHSDDYSHTVIDEFKLKPLPVITVSVDMMDTGIDVPEVVNLVFFKKVRSKIKFWQMIGRGTRLCPALNVVDPLDTEHPGGAYQDKRRFFIFDWCRNFKYFGEGGDTTEGKIGASLSEIVFSREAQLAKTFQTAAYADDDWQAWRGDLVSDIHYQVVQLDEELISVRLHRPAVQKFKQEKSYVFINDTDLSQLQREVAPLVHNEESDVYALRFDALMYGFMCALTDGMGIEAYRKKLVAISLGLQDRITIPQVKEKLSVLLEITEEHFFDGISALSIERIRKEIRGIVKFLVGKGTRNIIYTDLADPVTDKVYGVTLDSDEDFVDYKLKVNRYLSDYENNIVINKLRSNKPMTSKEYKELERIFTHDLGTAEEYNHAYGDTPFGLLVRKVVKLDHEAAMEAFADFINDESLTEQQIAFVHRVIDYIENNGYMEPGALAQAPFDRPQSFVRLFDTLHQIKLVEIIKRIKSNAETPAA